MTLDFTPVFANWSFLMQGMAVTVQLTACSLLLGSLLGLLIALFRLRPPRSALHMLGTAYLVFFRGTPLLVQLFILFFGLPQFGLTLPAFACGVLGLGMYGAAYISEIIRGAVQSIDRGQSEAARSLGFSASQSMAKIVFPQAVVRMIPPLGNELIALIKHSALASLLTIDDLMHQGQKIISVSYRSLETYLVVAALYLALTTLAMIALRVAETRLRAGGMVV